MLKELTVCYSPDPVGLTRSLGQFHHLQQQTHDINVSTLAHKHNTNITTTTTAWLCLTRLFPTYHSPVHQRHPKDKPLGISGARFFTGRMPFMLTNTTTSEVKIDTNKVEEKRTYTHTDYDPDYC